MRNILLLAFVLGSIAPLSSFAAPDPLKAAPEMYKLLFENETLRIMEVTFKPGQKIAEHTHPNTQYVTVLEPGTLTIHHPDGSAAVNELKANQVVEIPAETHWAQNTGKSDVKLLVTETKK